MAGWSWQATQALLQRLQQPTSATVAAEYANISKMEAFHTVMFPAPGSLLTTLPLPEEQYTALIWQWCSMAKPLLCLLAVPASAQCPHAVSGAGKLLSVLATCLEVWMGAAAGEGARMALKQQIAQHTSGLLPLLGKLMPAAAAIISSNTAQRQRKASEPESAQAAAEAAHARDYFPNHPDIATGLHLLILWNALAGNWPGTLLRTSTSSSADRSNSSSRSSSGGDSSTSMQQTILPACELAVSILKTWPPNIPTTWRSSSSSSESLGVPNGAIPRRNVSNMMFVMARMLIATIRDEVIRHEQRLSAADDAFVCQLSASAAVQHLLLLELAISCRRQHKQQQGLSHFKAKEAVAAVTGSRHRAAAAAAAEAATGSSSSSSSSGGGTSPTQRQYLTLPAHHTAVLELLLVPEDSAIFPLPAKLSCDDELELVLTTYTELVLGVSQFMPGWRECGLPNVPLELCAPLYCMLAEAAALAPASVYYLRAVLVFMQGLQDV